MTTALKMLPPTLVVLALAFGAGIALADAEDGAVTATPSRTETSETLKAVKAEGEKAKDEQGESAIGKYLSQVHGSVSATIGTDGTRAVYAEATMPLGDRGWLSLAFSTGRYGPSQYYGGPGYYDGVTGGWLAPYEPYAAYRRPRF